MRRFTIQLVFIIAAAGGVMGQTDIRRADFKNFTHSVHCLGDTPENITVKNGEYSLEKQEDGYVDRYYLQVFSVSYGDLNADSREEAVVLTVCNTGGTGNFSEGLVYSIRAGKPVLIARIPGGDRAYGGLRTARVEKGLLVVESMDVGDEGAACCPQWYVTTRYKVVGGKLQPQGTPLKEPVDRAERITFQKGRSSSTFKAYIPGSEAKKFVVGARAGQTLSVSVRGDNASVRLITPSEHNSDKRSFRALLPNTGDYTFEVQNDSATENEITITVTIQ